MRSLVLGFVMLTIHADSGEAVCFRTANEAAAQLGRPGTEGFRLDTLRRDVFSGLTWATVSSCEHPERPKITVSSHDGVQVAVQAVTQQQENRKFLVRAGMKVRLVRVEETMRLELEGVAQANGVLGDRVRVKILSPYGVGEEKFVTGLIRSSALLEMEW